MDVVEIGQRPDQRHPLSDVSEFIESQFVFSFRLLFVCFHQGPHRFQLNEDHQIDECLLVTHEEFLMFQLLVKHRHYLTEEILFPPAELFLVHGLPLLLGN